MPFLAFQKHNWFILIVLALGCQNMNQDIEGINPDSRNNYQVAYNVLVDEKNDDYDIWVTDLAGNEKRNITSNPDVAWTYTGLGEKVLFISDRDTCSRCYFLYEMNADGSDVVRISDFKLTDSWMGVRKNGEEIIVNPHRSVDSVFYIINRKGQILNKISSGLEYSSDPCFSPDGNIIAFRGANKKSKRNEGHVDEIYLINDDGTNLTKLTTYPEKDTTAPWYAYNAGPPRFHPTEDFISYASFQDGKYSLYGITLDGQKQWKLLENKYSEVYHDWSSNGKWLVSDISDATETQYHIGLTNWETKESRILTDTSFTYQQSPVFLSKKNDN